MAAALPSPARVSGGSAPETDWTETIQRIAKGEQGALARLYDQSSSLVYGLALRILSNPEDAEEVTVDVFSQVWRSAANFDPARGNATSWLVMIARSRSIDRLRKRVELRNRERAIEDLSEAPDHAPPVDEASFLSQRRERVRAALGQLPPEQRELIELAFFQGYSHSEVAEKTGLPLGTVKTRLRLGMIKMRDHLTVAGGAQ